MQWFIVGLILLVGLAVWNHKRTQGQQQALQDAGFTASHDLKGNPKLLVSDTQRQIAIVRGGEYLRVDFEQVQTTGIEFDAAAANDRNFRVRVQLRDSTESSVDIAYQDELDAKAALKQLDQLLGR